MRARSTSARANWDPPTRTVRSGPVRTSGSTIVARDEVAVQGRAARQRAAGHRGGDPEPRGVDGEQRLLARAALHRRHRPGAVGVDLAGDVEQGPRGRRRDVHHPLGTDVERRLRVALGGGEHVRAAGEPADGGGRGHQGRGAGERALPGDLPDGQVRAERPAAGAAEPHPHEQPDGVGQQQPGDQADEHGGQQRRQRGLRAAAEGQQQHDGDRHQRGQDRHHGRGRGARGGLARAPPQLLGHRHPQRAAGRQRAGDRRAGHRARRRRPRSPRAAPPGCRAAAPPPPATGRRPARAGRRAAPTAGPGRSARPARGRRAGAPAARAAWPGRARRRGPRR